MNTSSHQRPHAAFSLIELMVVIAIVAVLAGMLLPVVGMVRSQAHALRCGGQVRQCTLALLAYAGDNDGSTPAGLDLLTSDGSPLYIDNWGKVLVGGDYLEERSLLHCPTVRPQGPNWWFDTYGFSSRWVPVTLPTLAGASTTLALADSSRGYDARTEAPVIHQSVTAWENYYACLRHARCGNASFFDGHGERLPAARFAELGYCNVHQP